MIIHTELKFDIEMASPEEKADIEKFLETHTEEEMISALTADIYEVFKDEMIQAANVDIKVSLTR